MSRSVPLSALQVFMEVCKQGSMKLAADRLSVTPGAVSQQVKSLEERMGMPLFSRAHRRLELTPPGERLKAQLAASFAAIETVWGDYECSRRRVCERLVDSPARPLPGAMAHYRRGCVQLARRARSAPHRHRRGDSRTAQQLSRPSEPAAVDAGHPGDCCPRTVARRAPHRDARRLHGVPVAAGRKPFFMAAVAQGIRPRRQPLGMAAALPTTIC
jgi:DNA-binding MarR family transcriptional regulator